MNELAIRGLGALVVAMVADSQRSSEIMVRGASTLSLPAPMIFDLMVGEGAVDAPLAGMSFEQAVQVDPRRVEATIHRMLALAFDQVMDRLGFPRDYEGRRYAYLESQQLIERVYGQQPPASALLAAQEENWGRQLLMNAQHMPVEHAREFLAQRALVDAAFAEARTIARGAARVDRRAGLGDEARAWEDYAENLSQQQQGWWIVCEARVRGKLPMQALRQLPVVRKLLTGPAGEPELLSSPQAPYGETRLTLVPAYGRDYKSKAAVLEAWNAGKDFLICDMSSVWDGKPTNKSDCARMGVRTVNIRYNAFRSVAVVQVA